MSDDAMSEQDTTHQRPDGAETEHAMGGANSEATASQVSTDARASDRAAAMGECRRGLTRDAGGLRETIQRIADGGAATEVDLAMMRQCVNTMEGVASRIEGWFGSERAADAEPVAA